MMKLNSIFFRVSFIGFVFLFVACHSSDTIKGILPEMSAPGGATGPGFISKPSPTWTPIRVTQGPSKGNFSVVAGRDLFVLLDNEFMSWQQAFDGFAWQKTDWGYSSHCMGNELLYLNDLYWCAYSVYPWNKFYIRSSSDLVKWEQTVLEGNTYNNDPVGMQYLPDNGLYIIGGNHFSLTSTNGTSWVHHSDTLRTVYTNHKLTVSGGSYLLQLFSPILWKTSDGVNWSNNFVNLGFSPKKLLRTTGGTLYAFGDSGKISFSTNESNWSTVSTGSYAGTFNDAVIGSGTFVVVGDGGEIKISTTGGSGSWQTVVSNPSFGNLNSVAYRDGVFVAAGSDGLILRSVDGLNWGTNIPMPGHTNDLSSVAYGNGKFVLSTGRAELMILTDSTTGSHQYVNATNFGKINKVIFAGDYFWGLNGNNYKVYRSSNGTDWVFTEPPLGCAGGYYCGFGGVAYGNGKYVAIGGVISTSEDGQNWSSPVDISTGSGMARRPIDIVFSNGSFYVAGEAWNYLSSQFDIGFVAASSDGVTWSYPTMPSSNITQLVNIASNGTGTLMAMSLSGEFIHSVDNGSNWSVVSAPFVRAAGDTFSLKYMNGQFLILAISYTTFMTRVFYSGDGLIWAEETNLGSNYIKNCAFNPLSNRYISVGWPSYVGSFQANGIDYLKPPNFSLTDLNGSGGNLTKQNMVNQYLGFTEPERSTHYCITNVFGQPPLPGDSCFVSLPAYVNSMVGLVTLGTVGANDFYVYVSDGTVVSAATHARVYYSNTPPPPLTGVRMSRADMGPNGPPIVYTNQTQIWLSVDDHIQFKKWCIRETTDVPLTGSAPCWAGAGSDEGWYTRSDSASSDPQFLISNNPPDGTRVFYIWGADYYNNVTQIATTATIIRDTVPPQTPVIVARDLSSGSIGVTDQAVILVTTATYTSETTAWCLMVQAATSAPPTTPSSLNACWTPIASSATLNLTGGTGTYGVWAFTKDAAANISVGTGYSEIIYSY